jgi:hypothetical protein
MNHLVYPILFLYRHHLELRLKDILSVAQRVGIRKGRCPKNHDIKQQWSEVRPILSKLAGKGDRRWFQSVAHCIKQIAELDPTSDAFRYPTTKGGSDSVKGVTQVHIGLLRETMTEILDWLEAGAGLLHDQEGRL